MSRHSDSSRTVSTASKETATVIRFRRFAARIGIRKPQSAPHSANPSNRHQPRHPRTRREAVATERDFRSLWARGSESRSSDSGGDVALIQNPRSARRDHFDVPLAKSSIGSDAALVGLNAPRTTFSRHQPRPAARRTTRTLNALLGLVLAAALALPAAASAAGPQFSLTITHSPNRFLIGETGSYSVTVTNSGDAPTSAPIALTNTLPPNLVLSALTPGPDFSCSGDGSLATPLSCARTEPLGPGESDSIQLDVAASVGGDYDPNSGENLATNTATVSGGGVAGVVSTSDLVAVYPPYALKYFLARTTTDASEATHSTVAGGHPSQTLSAFEFSFVWGGGSLPLKTVDDPKDVYVTLPLGFIGNPAAATRCPFSSIHGDDTNTCPSGSQVGEAELAAGVKFLVLDPGVDSETHPIFNVVPDYGSPAQFFFKVVNTPVVLKAILHPRTESYAISVGAIDSPQAGVHGVRTSFFGVPAQNGAPGPVAPFLSNPLDCSEAEPAWKFASDSWQHPGVLGLNGLPDPSDPDWLTATETTPPVSGCDNPDLASQFDQTTIAVKPLQGPGPVQADSPAGLAVDLDFPQSNDPTDPEHHLRPQSPPGPRAQGHHRQAPGRLRYLPVLGRRPRRLLRPRL